MINIASITFEIPTPVNVKSKRNDLLNQLYEIYQSQPEFTQKENRKRYAEYMRLYHRDICEKKPFSKQVFDGFKQEFREAKLPKELKYIKPIKQSDYVWWSKFTHLTGEEGNEALEYMISVAKDKKWRKQNVGAFILGATK